MRRRDAASWLDLKVAPAPSHRGSRLPTGWGSEEASTLVARPNRPTPTGSASSTTRC